MSDAAPHAWTCSRERPREMCLSRRDAQHDGSMFYSVHHGGWVFPAENRAVPQLLRKERVPPTVWTFCPFCGGPLPDEVSAVERVLERPEWMGEDGG